MASPSLIDVIEAAYDVDSPDDTWMRNIVDAGARVLDRGLGVSAFTYDASVPARMTVERFVSSERQKHWDETTVLGGIEASGGAPYVRATYLATPCETVTQTPDVLAGNAEAMFRAIGIGDILGINGLDPSGQGIFLGVSLPRPTKLPKAQRERYARVAAHLGASYRLPRRLASAPPAKRSPWDADGILSARGRMEHAANDELRATGARERLRAAAADMDAARGRLRRIDPDSGLGRWMGLVDGRWSLVDKFDRDGKRYVLVRRNHPHVANLDALTERERVVAAYAALGHTNKLIAYDLGIAHSTVRVLLARAAAKLGARTREELVDTVRSTVRPP